jgi:hypothetical protein
VLAVAANSPQNAAKFLPSAPSPLAPLMKFTFKIKTEPVTQAGAIIVAVVAFSSGSLATVAFYAQSPPVSIICLVVLAIVVYLALRFSHFRYWPTWPPLNSFKLVLLRQGGDACSEYPGIGIQIQRHERRG